MNGIQPRITWSSMHSASYLVSADWTLEEMENKGVEPDLNIYNTVLEACHEEYEVSHLGKQVL